jgi:hypothetical protein
MSRVGTTDVRTTSTEPPREWLDRRVLVANVVAGALWLFAVAFWTWPLPIVGAAYVAVASVFLAAVYARGTLSRRREGLAWAASWLAAVALWASIFAGVDGVDIGDAGSAWVPDLLAGLVVGTACYLAWQISALAVRQLMAWREKR